MEAFGPELAAFAKALADRMKACIEDPRLESGDGGLVEPIGYGDDGEPVLAAMPWDLYCALKYAVDQNPATIDPRFFAGLCDEHLLLLAAYMRLELGIDDDADSERQHQGGDPN